MPDDRTHTKPEAYICLLLHAHLPFVRHPEHAEFLEERWLFEAVRECYLPLIRILRARAGIRGGSRIALSLSPTLMAMLDDALLRSRIARYLERVCRFADAEVKRTAGDARLHPLTVFYQSLAATNLSTWTQINGDVVHAFLQAAHNRQIELLTTSATHAFLPIWRRHPDSICLQIRTGIESFAARAGYRPSGFWLPECGYYKELEHYLADEGIRYFFTESHGLLHANPPPPHGVSEPIVCPNGVAVFGRDPESSRQVWSSQGGYPGDPDYREYYRDIGSTLERDRLENIFPLAGLDPATGFKYHRVTGPDEDKALYHPIKASEKARQHAADFLDKKRRAAENRSATMARPAVFAAPYDAELFGHWWFEGPVFLEELMRLCDQDGDVQMITPADYLDRHAEGMPEAQPAASTWGARGYSGSWVNESTAWMYPHLFRAADDFPRLRGSGHRDFNPELRKRLQAQLARELLLVQASDWPFMLTAGHHAPYAEKRIRDHLARYCWIAGCLESGVVDQNRLDAIESADRIFAGHLLEYAN